VKIVIGGDHAGYALKEKLKKFLGEKGIQVTDIGTNGLESVDYPDYAEKAASLVASGEYTYGILVCGTGNGMAMAANKIPRIRAAVCNDLYSARYSREHNDANILALGAWIIGCELAKDIINIWLNTQFLGDRHAHRIKKITNIEKRMKIRD